MSTFDRLSNLARGVVVDGQKRFEAKGGLEGAARRAGETARAVVGSARAAVEGLQSEPSTASAPPDAAWHDAQAEVDGLHTAAGPRGPAQTAAAATPPDALATALEALDRALHAGTMTPADWERERSRVLDAHDRAHRSSPPRPRTL